jgi:hypothetical protein
VDTELQPTAQDITQELEDGAFALYVPNTDTPYKRYHNPDEWVTGYAELVSRIMSSDKITDGDKQDKLRKLSEVNKPVTQQFDSFTRVSSKVKSSRLEGQ